jgi:putative glutamine amidotransferase
VSDARPLVGITVDFQAAARGRTRYTVYDTYVNLVRASGARPLILPPDTHGGDDLLALVHGVVLPGGSDIDPARWGGVPGAGYSPADPRRTAQDLAVATSCMERAVPLLGICLGLQTINVACGGSLKTELPLAPVRHQRELEEEGEMLPRHRVAIEAGTRLAAALGVPEGGSLEVNSSHRWAADRVGAGLAVAARAEDGVVEAIERPDLPFCVGVQWHPEHGREAPTETTRRLMAAFVGACRDEAARRR